MKRFPGHKLALAGLTVGLLFGLGVLLFKNWLAQQIVEVIEDELKASCSSCTLAFDSLTISFSTLSGRATRVRLLDNGKPKLSFDRIDASFSVAQLLEKKIFISTLLLRDGVAAGVGPDSVTFRFIDQLTKPVPPERDRPGRWRAILDSLEVKEARFLEPFRTSELSGEGLHLFVERQGESFILTPKVDHLRYRSFTDPLRKSFSELDLGALSASLSISDGITTFRNITVGKGDSLTTLAAIVDGRHGDTCSGDGTLHIDSRYIGLPEWLKGSFQGTTNISGTIGSPIFKGPLTTGAQQLGLQFPNATPVTFDQMAGQLTIDLRHGDPLVSLNALSAQNSKTTLQSTSPLLFSDEGLTAGFAAKISQFSYGPFTVDDVAANISVLQASHGTATEIDLLVGNLSSQGVSIGPAKIKIFIGPDGAPDAVDVVVDSTDLRQGSFHAEGRVLAGSRPEALLEKGLLALTNYRYPLALPLSEKRLSPIAITTSMSLAGPLDLAKLVGAGAATVAFPSIGDGVPLSGTVALKNGVLTADLPSSNYQGSALLKVDVARTFSGTLRASLDFSSLEPFVAAAKCSDVDADLDYSFPLSSPLGGTGSLRLGEFKLGCAPYQLAVQKNLKLPIVGGALRMDGTTITGANSALNVRGTMSINRGYDLALKGDLFLSALLPFVSSVDDLQGQIETSLSIKGDLNTPQIAGTARLKNGEIGLVSPDLAAHEVQGSFTLSSDLVRINAFSGKINNGSFDLSGGIDPLNLANSKLDLRFRNVLIEPADDASLSLSGALRITKSDTGKQLLSGEVFVDFAEITRDLDPNKMLVQALAGFFSSSPKTLNQRKEPIDLELDLVVEASRNMFILTPLLSAELSAQLRVRGTASEPAVLGSMQVLNGWLGLKDNRFEITSGIFRFKPGSLEPTLEIVSEGTLRSGTGENILVLLEATGPLSSPRIQLSSDRGLSNQELLILLTAGTANAGRTLANSVGQQLGRDRQFLLSSESFSSIGSFFNSLTRIDSLSVDPIFNPYSGQTEPAVVGRKNIAARLSILGQSTFGTAQNARAGFVYDLTSSLNASSFLETVPSRQNTALRADLTYTIISKQQQVVEIDVRGLTKLDREDILRAARIGTASRIKNTPEVFAAIDRDILGFCFQSAYLKCTVRSMCLSGDEYCHHLTIDVSEGPLFTIKEISLLGESIPDLVTAAISRLKLEGEEATAHILQRAEDTVSVSARSEGFIAARTTSKYELSDVDSSASLVINADLRTPISFIFKGNTLFTDAEFLDSIQLFSRKRPFGNNTIQLLVRSIERMYQERGYLLVQVNYTQEKDEAGRIIYTVTIEEDTQTPVISLDISGNTSLSLAQITSSMKSLGFTSQLALLNPTYAVPDDLDSLREILVAVFVSEGFPQCSVSYEITPNPTSSGVNVQFTVIEGVAVRINRISIAGAPSDLTMPALPSLPASIPGINRLITRILDTLRDSGFLFPSISSDLDPTTSDITLAIIPGERTIISSVTFDGLSQVSEKVVLQYSRLEARTPYSATSINETKRSLLQSGLFSRVEIVATDGSLDSAKENLIVRVTERPLQTLEVGGGANSEFGIHVFGEAIDKSLFADGQSLALRLDSYVDNSSVASAGGLGISQGFGSMRYVNPSLLNSDFSLTEELRYQRQDTTTFEFNQDRVSLASYIYTTPQPGITLSAGHTILLENLDSVNPGAVITDLDTGSVRLGFLSGIIAVDRRDDPLLPQSGYTFRLEPKVASSIFGSEGQFASLTARASTVLPLNVLSSRFSLGLGAAAGFASYWGSTQEIPISQRYYLGGRTTVRGFRENSLGPRSSDGAVIGGDTMLMGKSQLQYLLDSSISSHIFFDSGTVFLRNADLSISEMRLSTGVGFRYLSPIGPLGIDIGHPLQERGGESSIRLHFSVGSDF
jgi:outer membrane protein insertion porin family